MAALSLALFAWCLFLRAPAFLRGILDWDETLYAIVADQWLHGNLPYIGVWDRKPVGIFAALAVGFSIFGSTIFALRLMAVLAVFAGAVLLYLLGARLLGSRRGGAVAAIAYPVFSLMPGALATNTELFFVAANLAGLWILFDSWWRPRSGPGRAGMLAAAGLMFGIAFQFKFVAVAESGLFVLAFLVAERRWPRGASPSGAAPTLFALGAGFLAPSLIAAACFAAAGAGSEYLYANFGANLQLFESHLRPAQLLARIAADFAGGAATWLWWMQPILLIAALAAILPSQARVEGPDRKEFMSFLGAWFVAALVEISATFRFYTHSFVSLIPISCLMLGLAFGRLGLLEGSRARCAGILALVCAIAMTTVAERAYVPWLGEFARGEIGMHERAAAHLRSRLGPGETLFVVNDQPLLYFLTGATPPTRYVLPDHLFTKFGSGFAGVNPAEEIGRVLQRKPAYITIQDVDRPTERQMQAAIALEYKEEIRFDSLVLYRWCGGPCESRSDGGVR